MLLDIYFFHLNISNIVIIEVLAKLILSVLENNKVRIWMQAIDWKNRQPLK